MIFVSLQGIGREYLSLSLLFVQPRKFSTQVLQTIIIAKDFYAQDLPWPPSFMSKYDLYVLFTKSVMLLFCFFITYSPQM